MPKHEGPYGGFKHILSKIINYGSDKDSFEIWYAHETIKMFNPDNPSMPTCFAKTDHYVRNGNTFSFSHSKYIPITLYFPPTKSIGAPMTYPGIKSQIEADGYRIDSPLFNNL